MPKYLSTLSIDEASHMLILLNHLESLLDWKQDLTYSLFHDKRFRQLNSRRKENEIYSKLTIIPRTVILIKALAYYSARMRRKQALSKCNTDNQSVV